MTFSQNSCLDLNLAGMKPRPQPRTMAQEMKDTLDKINELLSDINKKPLRPGSGSVLSGQTTSEVLSFTTNLTERVTKEMNQHLESGEKKPDVNKFLTGLCEDISSATKTLKDRRKKADNQHSRKRVNSKTFIQSLRKQEPKARDTTPFIKGSTRRTSSFSLSESEATLDSKIPSIKSDSRPVSLMTQVTQLSAAPRPPSGLVTSTQQRRSSNGGSGACYRGSVAAKIVSQHNSHFASIAELTGEGTRRKGGKGSRVRGGEGTKGRGGEGKGRVSGGKVVVGGGKKCSTGRSGTTTTTFRTPSSSIPTKPFETPESDNVVPTKSVVKAKGKPAVLRTHMRLEKGSLFTEYPSQGQNRAFTGISRHDIQQMRDDVSRGIIII